MHRIASFLCVAVSLIIGGPATASYVDHAEAEAYVDEVSARHGFPPEWVRNVLTDATRQESILAAISRPAEKAKPWHEYREIFVTASRTEAGVAFWREHEALISASAERYGVRPEILVAIVGVETLYGRITGRYRVIDALATLGFDYPPRARFFRKELTEFLLIAREEGRDPAALKGSYAGAMGLGQFIPSSFRAYAVDFDDDGKRDIWTNTADALGSVANYFSRHGWRGDGPTVVQVTPPAGELSLGTGRDDLANRGLALDLSLADVRAAGFGVDVDVDDDARVALFRMEGVDTDQYYLAFHDFYVITRYNHSAMYALAVFQLSEALRTAYLGG